MLRPALNPGLHIRGLDHQQELCACSDCMHFSGVLMPSQLKSVFDALGSLPLSEDSPENGKTNIRISFSTNYQKHEDQCPQTGNSLYLLIFFSILNCVFYKIYSIW